MWDFFEPQTLQLLEAIISLIMIVFGAVATFVVSFLPGKWKRDGQAAVQAAEANLRQGLHSAAVTGVVTGINEGHRGSDLIRFALRHMIKSVPGIIISLTPATEEIFQSPSVDEVLDKLPPKVRDALENIVKRYVGNYLPEPGVRPL